MAEEQVKDTGSATQGDTQPEKAAPPREEMVPKKRLDETMERLRQMELTLQALQTNAQRTQAPATGSPDDIATIAQAMGMEQGDVETWDRFFNLLLTRNAKPYVNALGTLADGFDEIKTRTAIKDYGDFEQLIQHERETAARNAKYLSREEAYHIVRSRNLEKILEKERAAVAGRQQADEQAHAVEGEQSISTPGPTHAAEPFRIPSREAFSRLSFEEQEKVLDKAGAF